MLFPDRSVVVTSVVLFSIWGTNGWFTYEFGYNVLGCWLISDWSLVIEILSWITGEFKDVLSYP